MKRITLLLFAACLMVKSACAQNIEENPTPGKMVRMATSPEVNFAIKEINTSTDYYTGIVNVKIPLYEMELNNYSIPIALSYAASGIRSDDISSVVGLGWRLAAGGKITRAVRGKPDNIKQRANTSGIIGAGQLFFEKCLQEEWDTQPDMFYFELPNLSGSFVLDSLRPGYPIQGYTVPYQQVKIEYDDQEKNFKIYDDKGNIYCFNTYDYANEINKDTKNVLYHSVWFLDKIVMLNGDEVHFEYIEGDTTNIKNRQYVATIRVEYNESRKLYESRPINSSEVAPTIQVTKPHYLSRITYKDQRIDFNYDVENSDITNMRKLNSIVVSWVHSNEATPVRTFDFLYGRFAHDRLRLDGIQERSDTTLIRPICNFEYYEDVNVPERGRMEIDHWGYFNSAQKNNEYLFPQVPIKTDFDRELFDALKTHPLTAYVELREPNLYYTRVLSLKKILYPNGGSKEFVYELHRGYDKIKTRISDAGGLRIRKILTKDSPTAAPVTCSYTYEGGVVYDEDRNYILSEKLFRNNPYGKEYDLFYISSKNPNNTVDYYGASVVYSSVTEHLPNGSSVRYDYTPYEEYPDLAPYRFLLGGGNLGVGNNCIIPKTSRSWGRNLLRSKTTYDASNNRVDSVTYEYLIETNKMRHFYGYTLHGSYIEDGVSTYNKKYMVGKYSLISVPVYLSKQVNHAGKYNPHSETTYKYNNFSIDKLVREIQTIESDGTITKKTFKYAQDFEIPDSAGVAFSLADRNVCIPLEEISYRNGKVVAAKGRSFRFNERNLSAIVLDSEKSLKKASPIEAADFAAVECTSSKITFNNLYKDDKKYLDYNSDGQLLCYQDENEIRHSFVYRNTTQPIATVLNARHSENPALNEVYFDDFEMHSEPYPFSNSKSGTRHHIGGNYTIDTRIAPGSYVVTGWKQISPWTKCIDTIEITSSSTLPRVSLGSAVSVDDVSITPPNSTISSCVYVPGWGKMSETNEQNLFFNTSYNGLGLPTEIRDNRNVAVKRFEYY